MNDAEFKGKVSSAYKWSSITVMIARIITPVMNMLLARILAPEAFGVLATVTMVIAFAENLVENGFQKYLIQREFSDAKTEDKYISVAFWANAGFGFILWLLISVFSDQIAALVGNPGMGHLFIISGVMVPLYAIIGIQYCKLRKDFKFKQLFVVRITAALIPLVVTLPLALLGFDYWSLIIGNIAGLVVQFVTLCFTGKFKLSFVFSFSCLKEMLQSGIWTMADGLLFWGTSWIDSLIIANYMTGYYLGLYKNSVSVVNSLFTIVTAAVTPVLYSTLSRLQNDKKAFNNTFLDTQHILAFFLLPMSIGLFVYRDFATSVMFGSKWAEAANIIGVMGLTTACRTIFVSIYGDLYRAKGNFYTSPLLQVLDILLLVPACWLAAKKGFWTLVYVRAIIKLDLILPELLVAKKICGLPIHCVLGGVLPVGFAATLMGAVGMFLHKLSGNVAWTLLSVLICMLVYATVLCFFPKERKILVTILSTIKRYLSKLRKD